MQNRKTAPPGMYTAKEAQSKIGVPQSSFYNLVRAGTIKGIVLPGRKEAVYPAIEIDRYARAIRAYIDQFNEEKMSFGLALVEDIEEIRSLVAAASGGYSHAAPAGIMEAWMRKNPEALHILRRGATIVGYISIFPLPLETILKRMSNEYRNRTLPIDDIQPYSSGVPLRLYIAEAIVNPSEDPRKRVAARLISEIARYLLDLGKQGVIIEEVYAVGTSLFGIRACRSLGMTALDMPGATREDRVPFVLNVEQSQDKIIRAYRRAIKEA
ncbi:MAG: hypothetical protein ACRDHZ_00030 [Ktedonobacteraceae bacterium]